MPVVTPRHRKAAARENVTVTAPPVVEALESDLGELTKSELKDLASLRGLSTSGNKGDLIARLEA